MSVAPSPIAFGLFAFGLLTARAADGEKAVPGSTSDPELSPQLEKLISAKEREVRVVRAEGIKLLEDFLAGSAQSPETAEALFKLAELTWEEAQADYLDRMGRHQDLVAACKRDRSRCPELPRKAAEPGSVAFAGDLPASHPRVPGLSQARHRALPLRLFPARPGADRGGHRRVPAVAGGVPALALSR